MVCTGGMLAQQPGIMRAIDLAQKHGKYVVVGGPDPTSQRDLYTQADAVVVGEGESSIPVWLRRWEAGQSCGRFEPDATVDMTTTPIPRWDHHRIETGEENYRLKISVGVDQMLGGLNFVTVCDRVEIYQELSRVVADVYSPAAFMSRVLDTARRLELNSRHQPNAWEWRRMLRGFAHVSWSLTMNRSTRWHYLKTAWKAMWLGFQKFEYAHTTMGAFLHFHRQAEAMQFELKKSIEYAQYVASYPRSVRDMPAAPDKVALPVLPVESC